MACVAFCISRVFYSPSRITLACSLGNSGRYRHRGVATTLSSTTSNNTQRHNITAAPGYDRISDAQHNRKATGQKKKKTLSQATNSTHLNKHIYIHVKANRTAVITRYSQRVWWCFVWCAFSVRVSLPRPPRPSVVRAQLSCQGRRGTHSGPPAARRCCYAECSLRGCHIPSARVFLHQPSRYATTAS